MTRTFAALIGIALVLGGVRRAGAQVVRGDVTDSVTHAPVLAALVVAYDTAGARAAGAITDDSGHFALRLPKPGRYRLQAERIGYRSRTPVTFDIAAGATRAEHLLASSVAVVLPTDTVTGQNRCTVHPAEGEKTAALWMESRKALYATAMTLDGQLVYAIIHTYKRSLDGTSLLVRWDSSWTDTVVLPRPFQTPATPEQLALHGYGVIYKGDSAYAAPDAEVLLSDDFARTHCFRLRMDSEKHAGLIGLAFEPSRKRREPDVMGTMWLDSATARLRFVEFRHTNLFPEVSPLRYGGRLDFEQLEGGAWIVRRWSVRIPIVGTSTAGAAGGADLRYIGAGPHVARFHEDGGEVLSATVLQQSPP